MRHVYIYQVVFTIKSGRYLQDQIINGGWELQVLIYYGVVCLDCTVSNATVRDDWNLY
jgi:hypothetical protein